MWLISSFLLPDCRLADAREEQSRMPEPRKNQPRVAAVIEPDLPIRGMQKNLDADYPKTSRRESAENNGNAGDFDNRRTNLFNRNPSPVLPAHDNRSKWSPVRERQNPRDFGGSAGDDYERDRPTPRRDFSGARGGGDFDLPGQEMPHQAYAYAGSSNTGSRDVRGFNKAQTNAVDRQETPDSRVLVLEAQKHSAAAREEARIARQGGHTQILDSLLSLFVLNIDLRGPRIAVSDGINETTAAARSCTAQACAATAIAGSSQT